MPQEKAKCLVCNEVVRGTSGKEIFRKDGFGVQPVKERLQVVLQVNLDRRTSHSTVLCVSCVKQLDKIDDYQCNIEEFSETFSEALENRHLEEIESETPPDEKHRQCFVCNVNISSSENQKGVVVGSDDQPSRSLKTRLERALSVSLDKEVASLGGNIELCHPCMDNLGRIEKELKVVTDFASIYRNTRVLYDDDIDQDIAEAVDDDDDDDDGDDNEPMPEEEQVESEVVPTPLTGIQSQSTGMPTRDRPGRLIEDNSAAYKEQEMSQIEKVGETLRCKICGYLSVKVTHVRTHIRSHTGVQPYSCRLCGVSFKCRSNCTKHIYKCESRRQTQQNKSLPPTGLENTPLSIDLTESPGEESDTSPTKRSDVDRDDKNDDINKGEGEYGCSLCPASFHSAKAANSHMETHKHSKNGASTLNSPGSDTFVQAKDNPIYMLHQCKSDQLVEHSGNKVYKCKACNYIGTRRRVTEHCRIHTGEKPYQCQLCSRTYRNNCTYQRHIREHLAKGDKVPGHIMDRAEEAVILDSSPEGSENEDADNNNIPIQVPAAPAASTSSAFQCSLCSKCLDSSAELTEHIRAHIEETDKQVGLQKKRQKSQLAPHSQSLSEWQTTPRAEMPEASSFTQNNYNGQSSSSSVDYEQAEVLHDADVMAEAYRGNSMSVLASQFDDAGYDEEGEDPTAITDELRRTFYYQNIADDLYRCVKCPYVNTHLSSMRSHVRTHTGEKPYRCRHCNLRFACSSNRKKHERKYHKTNNSHRHEPTPAQAMPRPTAPALPPSPPPPHQITEYLRPPQPPAPPAPPVSVPPPVKGAKPFKCDICDVSFRFESTLKKHKELHDGNQLFTCMLCKRKFTSSEDLQVHLSNDHSQQNSAREFKCKHCGTSFPTAQSRDAHVIQQHSSIIQQQIQDAPGSHLSATAFRSSIEQLETGIFRCVLCCQRESPRLNDIIAHQFEAHDASEVSVYNAMVNSGSINLIVEIDNGYKCKICPFTAPSNVAVQRHLESRHFVNVRTIRAEKPTNEYIDDNLIMRQEAMGSYHECLFCHVRHRDPEMIAKHVKARHPSEFADALKRTQYDRSMNSNQVNIPNEQRLRPSRSSQDRKRSSSGGSSADSTPAKFANMQLSSMPHLPYKCGLCQHMFEEPGDLQVHYGDHCPGQIYPFTQSLQLQVESQGIKQYFPCHLCGATYIKQLNLQKHLDNHASNLVPLQGMTDSMDQALAYYESLRKLHFTPNNRAHSGAGFGLTCVLCHMKFNDPMSLKSHVELHLRGGVPAPPPNQQIPVESNQLMPSNSNLVSPYQQAKIPPVLQQMPNPFSIEEAGVTQQSNTFPSSLMGQSQIHMPQEQNLLSQSSPPVNQPFPNIRGTLMEPSQVTPINICPQDDYSQNLPPMNQNDTVPQAPNDEKQPNRQIKCEYRQLHSRGGEPQKETDSASDTLTSDTVIDQDVSDEETSPTVPSMKVEIIKDKHSAMGSDQKLQVQALSSSSDFRKQSKSMSEKTKRTNCEIERLRGKLGGVLQANALSQFMNCIERLQQKSPKKLQSNDIERESMKIPDSSRSLITQILSESPLLKGRVGRQPPEPILIPSDRETAAEKDAAPDTAKHQQKSDTSTSDGSKSDTDAGTFNNLVDLVISNVMSGSEVTDIMGDNSLSTVVKESILQSTEVNDIVKENIERQDEEELLHSIPDDLDISDAFSDIDFDDSNIGDTESLGNLKSDLSAAVAEVFPATTGNQESVNTAEPLSDQKGPENGLGVSKETEILLTGTESNSIENKEVNYQAIDLYSEESQSELPEDGTLEQISTHKTATNDSTQHKEDSELPKNYNTENTNANNVTLETSDPVTATSDGTAKITETENKSTGVVSGNQAFSEPYSEADKDTSVNTAYAKDCDRTSNSPSEQGAAIQFTGIQTSERIQAIEDGSVDPFLKNSVSLDNIPIHDMQNIDAGMAESTKPPSGNSVSLNGKTDSYILIKEIKDLGTIESSEVKKRDTPCGDKNHSEVSHEELPISQSDSSELMSVNKNAEQSTVPGVRDQLSQTSERSTDHSQPSGEIICTICLKTLETKTMYLDHLKSHTAIKCPLCTQTFTEITSLYLHFESVH